MLSTSGRRTSLVLLASLLLSSSTALAGATDQHEDHAIKELIKSGGPATRAANRPKEKTATPPRRRHLVDSKDASPRETRNQMEQEYRRQQARRDNGDSSDESYDKDAYDHHKEAEDGSIYSAVDKSLCIAPNDNDDIVVRPCTNYDRREWTTIIVEGSSSDSRTYKFITWQNNDDKCITVRDDVKEGAKLKMGSCRDKEDYLWKLDDGGKWRPKADLGLCVDLDDAEEGTKPALRDCDDTKSQKWYVGKGQKDSSSNSDSDESDEECSDDGSEEESSDDEDHSTVFFYGKGKTSKSSKSSKSSGKGSNDSGKGSKSGYYPTHPSPSKPSCRPKSSSSSDDYWDHVKTSSTGSIYSLADESLCVAFNDDNDILMRDCTNDKDRQWSLMAIAGDSNDDMTYKFITWKKDKDKCITVRGQVKEGSELRMAKCDKDEKFLWKFNEGNQWRPKADLGLCVDLDKVREGTRPTLEDCGDTRRQRWDVGKGDDSSPSSPSASRPGSRPTPRPTQDPATCSVDRTCGRPRRPI